MFVHLCYSHGREQVADLTPLFNRAVSVNFRSLVDLFAIVIQQILEIAV